MKFFDLVFYLTMPLRLVAVGVACFVIILAAAMDRNIPEYCDFNHAWRIVVGDLANKTENLEY